MGRSGARARGPTRLQAIGYLRRLQGPGILDAIHELWQRHGDLVALPLPFGRTLYFVNDPTDVMEILVRQGRKFVKGKALDTFKLLMGNGVATSDQPLWVQHRRLVQPSFHHKVLGRYTPIVLDAFEEHRARWLEAGGGFLDFNQLLPPLAQDVVARTLLGADLSRQLATLHTVWDDAMAFVVKRTNAALRLPLAVPLPGHLRFAAARRLIRDSVDELVSRQLAGGTGDPGSFLSRLLASGDAQQLSRDEIVTQILNILFAGHETTGNGLGSALYLILSHPAVHAAIMEEIGAELGQAPPRHDRLERQSYLRQVVYETLRLYPPVSVFVREALEPVELGTGTLPQSAVIMLSPYILHRRAEIWPEPERFDPARFTGPHLMAPPHFFAFGAGGRTCLGDHYAINEMMLILTRMLQTLTLELDRSRPIGTAFNGTLRPDPLRIRVAPRREAA